jgi:SPW repeat
MKKQHWQDGISFLAGFWIFFAPWIIGSRGGALAIGDHIVVGILLILFAINGLAEFRRWKEWVNIVLGAWMLISPWLLHFSGLTALTWNAVISGVVVIICSCWALGEERGGKPLAR